MPQRVHMLKPTTAYFAKTKCMWMIFSPFSGQKRIHNTVTAMSLKHDAGKVVYGQSRLERDNAGQCFSPSWWHGECKHILQWAEEALSSCILALSIMLARIANRPWSACVQTVSLFLLHRTCHRNPRLPGRTFITQAVEWQAKSKKKNCCKIGKKK